VVLPYTKAGVIGGIMLGLGRALGETMAVTFVIGNFNQLDSLSLFAARQQHHLGAGQRVRRGGERPAPGGADLPGPGAVLHHLRRAVAVQAAAGAPAPQRRSARMSGTWRKLLRKADADAWRERKYAARKRVNGSRWRCRSRPWPSACSGWSGSCGRRCASASAA
jgi:hypothetical protein